MSGREEDVFSAAAKIIEQVLSHRGSAKNLCLNYWMESVRRQLYAIVCRTLDRVFRFSYDVIYSTNLVDLQQGEKCFNESSSPLISLMWYFILYFYLSFVVFCCGFDLYLFCVCYY
jgi:hypothetical protein